MRRWSGLAITFAAACSTAADNPAARRGPGEECRVSTQCRAGLICIDGACTEGGCRNALECSGDPGDGCDAWACVNARCVPGCFMAPDSGVEDIGPREDAGTSCDVSRAPVAGDLVLNEFHADPATGNDGDANGDGTRDSADDEFIEIANRSDNILDLAGVAISDSTDTRHVFGPRLLPCGGVIAVFGAGDTGHANWRSNWIPASTGGLSLNNGNDRIAVATSTAAGATSLLQHDYGMEADADQSLTRETDLDPTADFIEHLRHLQARGRRFSPGLRPDGTEY